METENLLVNYSHYKIILFVKKKKNSNLLAKFIFWKSFFLSEKQKFFFFFLKFIYQSDQLNKNTPTVSPGEDRRLDQTKHYK